MGKDSNLIAAKSCTRKVIALELEGFIPKSGSNQGPLSGGEEFLRIPVTGL